MLAVSSALTRTDPERLWVSAVFAAETGQTEAARTLGEAAAQGKPAYREQIPLLSSPN
jgi:hypothetical protein